LSGRRDYWKVRLAAAAEADFDLILQWTAERFGKKQADVYAETLLSALDALKEGPAIVGAGTRNEIAKGLFTLHVARRGRKGRHFVLFRVGAPAKPPVIDVLRLLHDAMDLPRHIESDERGR
jgi:toxin ParE1/3/4